MALRMVSSLRIAETRVEASRFAGRAQTAVETLERRVVLDGDEARHVERRPDFDAAALDHTLAAISAAVPVHRRDAGQGGDLVTVDLAELGQLGDQGAGDDIADARNALQQILLSAPDGAGFDQFVDGFVDARPLGFEPFEHGPERALRNAVVGSGQTLLLGIDYDDELAPTRQQFGEPDREVIGQCPRRRAHGLGEVGEHRGVDRIGLGQPADGAGELAHLTRIDDGHRQTGFDERGGNHALITAARLEHAGRRQRLQALDQYAQAFGVRRAAKRSAIRSDMHIDPRLRHIGAPRRHA